MSIHGSAPIAGLVLALSACMVGCVFPPRPAREARELVDSLENRAAAPPPPSREALSRRPSDEPGLAGSHVTELASWGSPTDPSAPFRTFRAASSDVRRLPPIGERKTHLRHDLQKSHHTLLDGVLADHKNYYSRRNLGALAVGVGIAAAVANTSLDEHFRDFYQENVRNVQTDEYSEALHQPKGFGNGYVTVPAFAGAALAGWWFDGHPLGRGVSEWGQRSLRTVLVGGPPLLAMQVATGSSRPGETTAGSAWTPFRDSNGVSGHSFMGAVPFLSAAKMTDDPFWKTAFYLGSTLPGLSRINDDGHYASQVALGWWMAYLAADAVHQTQRGERNLNVFPLAIGNAAGVGVEYRR